MSAKTTEERLANLERAVARMEFAAQTTARDVAELRARQGMPEHARPPLGRTTPLRVEPPMGGQVCADCKTLRLVLRSTSDGRFICITCLHKHMWLLCKHCKEPLSNGESHGRGHCVISDAEDPPDVAREQREAWEAKPPEDKDPATLLGEAATLAYRAEALAFEALHANALSVATQDIHSARALLVEAVSALKRATAWTENSK